MRTVIDLCADWRFVKTAAGPDAAAAGAGEPVCLPHTWNAADGQDGGNDYYRGVCWYVRTLETPALSDGGRAYLEFDGAAMTAEVWLNGVRLCRHEGGYARFRVDVTDALQVENVLAVSVDNGENDRVYPQTADFTFYGGLYRSVRLILVPECHFALEGDGRPALQVTPAVDGTRADVSVEAHVCGSAHEVVFAIGEMQRRAVVDNGCARALFHIEDVHLWDGLDDPYLYEVHAALPGDSVAAKFGCRTFSVDPEKGFFLNGRSYPLRGVSRHQDRAGVGNALTPEMHAEDMEILLESGANTVRLAHYQHAQEFYDLCDAHGVLAWAEIPYISMDLPSAQGNALSQMEALVRQNKNHPSIVCWGLSNEITAASAADKALLETHRQLHTLCRRLDPTRPTVIANVFMLETDSPLLEIPELCSYNLYYGWYVGELSENERFLDEFHAAWPNRCIGLSEYGADANPAFHSEAPERGDCSEEYQCLYHEHMLALIAARPYLWATHAWNLFDFAADGRDEGGAHGINQKGLVTMDRRIKKDAFYLYKAYWSRAPFVHLCGRRFIERAEAETEIKAYSNLGTVELLVDGISFGTLTQDKIFRFRVPLTGAHRIEARAGACADAISIRRVERPNPAYSLSAPGGAVNWFEKSIDPAYYSIEDTLGALSNSPEANAIVQRMMSAAADSRGDVAKKVKNNPLLWRMMQRMTLKGLLRQAGSAVGPGQAEALNAALQRIKKV